jgi:3-deoxy-D-manno-octulosonate 8-phosphate phosphatase (KDO 8-P phosphatase)
MLLTDVDGVWNDGRIWIDADGRSMALFHVHDGAGILFWHRAGGLSGFLSGRRNDAVAARARELGVHEVELGHLDKIDAYEAILARRGLAADEVAYVGDDLLDLPVLRRAGFAVTVPNARAEVRAAVDHVTELPGGRGAVREVVELLLRARGAWDALVAQERLP